MAEKKAGEELITQLFNLNVPFTWAAGEYVSKFLIALRDEGKILCNTCPECGRTLVPPRPICGRCHVRMSEKFQELSDKGTVLIFNVFEQSFWDPSYGKQREVPHTIALIQLDGPPTIFTHFLEETDVNKLHMGMRVQAVWKPKEQRVGHMRDILYFRTINE